MGPGVGVKDGWDGARPKVAAFCMNSIVVTYTVVGFEVIYFATLLGGVHSFIFLFLKTFFPLNPYCISSSWKERRPFRKPLQGELYFMFN